MAGCAAEDSCPGAMEDGEALLGERRRGGLGDSGGGDGDGDYDGEEEGERKTSDRRGSQEDASVEVGNDDADESDEPAEELLALKRIGSGASNVYDLSIAVPESRPRYAEAGPDGTWWLPLHLFVVSDAISGLDQQVPLGVLVDPEFEPAVAEEPESDSDDAEVG